MHQKQIRKLDIPPDPTPGLDLHEGGAAWKWDELKPEQGVFRGRWVLNSSKEHPMNHPDLATEMEEDEEDEDALPKVKWEDIEGEYTEEVRRRLVAFVDLLIPGAHVMQRVSDAAFATFPS